MDLSKLPRMSKTDAPPPPKKPEDVPDNRARESDRRDPASEPLGFGAEIWFMSIIGLLLIGWGHKIISYEIATLRHQPYKTGVTWTTGDKTDQEVTYPELQDMSGMTGGQYYTDLCLVLFGVTLIIDAVGRALVMTRLPGRAAILGSTLAITLFTVGYNFLVAAKYMHAGTIPIVSLIAIAFGGYLAMFQFAMFKVMPGRTNMRR